MLLKILLLNLVICLTNAGVDVKSAPKKGSAGFGNLVEKLEWRLRNMETRMQDEKEMFEVRMRYQDEKHAKEKKELVAMIKEVETRLEAKNQEMETRLEELEDKMKEEKDSLEKRERGLEASKLRRVEKESSGKYMTSSISNNALTNPSLRDLPIIIISATQSSTLTSRQTVTYESFLANFNNGNRPGGGEGVLDLDSGVFTCFTPGYYTVSFSAYAQGVPNHGNQDLFLYKNGSQIPESKWRCAGGSSLNGLIAVTGSRILILHLDIGDTLELRMTDGDYINHITLNIELVGLGFDYLV